jgi:adenylate cyclase
VIRGGSGASDRVLARAGGRYLGLMSLMPRLQRLAEPILSIGAYEGEPETARAGRRVFMVAFVLSTVLTIPQIVLDFSHRYFWVGVEDLTVTVVTTALLVAIYLWPRRIVPFLTLMFAVITAGGLVGTTLFGGLYPSGLIVIYGIIIMLAALTTIGLRAGIVWLGVYVVSVLFAAAVDSKGEPRYVLPDPVGNATFTLLATGVVSLAALGYFIRQRDLFQRRSDGLLHAILPAEVATRLKDGEGTIADDIADASVLFADVVGFTPLSASLSPAQLVTLLNEVFTVFDGFVAALGLEKIKTIGDAYMAAAGVPKTRPDHAHAIAELALRIRDHRAVDPLSGAALRFRIGIDSGPVTAGVIGADKFAYDLWGDTVNTASRMESSGVAGAIQITARTRELLGDAFACEPRGSVDVKGKGIMDTFLLIGRRAPIERQSR